jgi:hypothetical protein
MPIGTISSRWKAGRLIKVERLIEKIQSQLYSLIDVAPGFLIALVGSLASSAKRSMLAGVIPATSAAPL